MAIRAGTLREPGTRACMWPVLLAPLRSRRASLASHSHRNSRGPGTGSLHFCPELFCREHPSSFFKKTSLPTPKPCRFCFISVPNVSSPLPSDDVTSFRRWGMRGMMARAFSEPNNQSWIIRTLRCFEEKAQGPEEPLTPSARAPE